ncbi:hypothetical protein M0802_001490 [Mischocyttarus mexicanus]|nr:hypothetical protein M0802_001490 [Mischocyttarus mexicanus]
MFNQILYLRYVFENKEDNFQVELDFYTSIAQYNSGDSLRNKKRLRLQAVYERHLQRSYTSVTQQQQQQQHWNRSHTRCLPFDV